MSQNISRKSGRKSFVSYKASSCSDHFGNYKDLSASTSEAVITLTKADVKSRESVPDIVHKILHLGNTAKLSWVVKNWMDEQLAVAWA